ncbi:putative mitochondrial hypothetical protein [Leptomonas pyrrhocoris]|uniref:Uncharacterized protein n=1 Tax=Leptomonas pyrrhocoris TaxID=157538 RepID=A0A0N0DR30_LEPPY|nr:putative mitochondrial hypothetical protein [Leptomonas pyrrhocoris]XP_015652331.1 putative mitochondrial hypothetical protein [Leptomonas pyrrhocoris]KPA73891.1 putative mitochondrial hypothetical protein [Leptomonas pyrrhocoris]KPA73892.1 putative mitochondrial hypothetical protein [Leptomonas pyrrhocoris]|eukprot:XP_015652330.1 putative mitochondrial hypothetical protein [Leptomonas pyrrhocoris]
MTSAASHTEPIPLQLDVDYVDAAHDACFAWLKGKYAHLTQAAAACDAAPGKSDATESTDQRRSTKPQLDRSFLQRLENDVAACYALRWRAFAFPSHPTKPLSSSYRNDPDRKNDPSALTVRLEKVEKSERNDSADTPKLSDSTDGAAPSHHALVIRTRASADAKKKERKQRKRAKADGNNEDAASTSPSFRSPPMKIEQLVEKVVRDEEQIKLCRLLGEECVVYGVPFAGPTEAAGAPQLSWVRRWLPQRWRPLLGGYVSAPTRTDSARFLLFPQSAHPAVDFRDPTAPPLPRGKSLSDPQGVPCYCRGSVNWDVEKNNPAAAGTDETASAGLHRSPTGSSQGIPGLSYSVYAATAVPAASTSHQRHNWADAIELAVAVGQSRTERHYAPERAKVQRVTLLEDSAVVKVSQGNPRYSTSFTAATATVPNSGVKHQHETSPALSTPKTEKKKHTKPSSVTAVEDDRIDRLQLQDGYDSSVQYFALPAFWQRLVRPSLRSTESSDAAETGTGTQVLDSSPRGQYRVRWSGGPGLEVCRVSGHGPAQKEEASPSSLFTVFGRLWTESWLEVPLPWRLALKLRTQSAVVMPLEPSKPIWPPMVSTPTIAATTASLPPSTPGNVEGGRGGESRLREHPYLWATQGPRWDAALVRGFKNDYSGMHHARRWYSILSAELTLNGKAENGSGKPAGPASDEGTAASTSGPAASSRWKNTSLTAFANACVVDTVRDYPRASVGFSFVSKIPRVAITPFNELIPHKFECSFSWFAAFKPSTNNAEGSGSGFNVEFTSGVQPPPHGGEGAGAAAAAEGVPFFRVSPVETFQHMKCGLTWKFDT